MPISAVEEKKEEENLAEAVAGMAPKPIPEPDLEKEISEQIEKNIKTGEAVWLGEADATFLGLYKANSFKKTHGAILFLHDIGANADWANLIKPLRLSFAKKGWHTLSIQLPMVKIDDPKLDYLSHFDESVTRVNTGIEFLKQKTLTNIVIIGHGMGAVSAVFDLNKTPQQAITGLITMSLSGSETLKITSEETSKPVEEIANPTSEEAAQKEKKQEKKKEPEPASMEEPQTDIPDRDLFAAIAKIKIPFLDIYAQQDLQDVVREAEKRSEIMESSGNPTFFQWEIEGADHYYRGQEDQITKRLRGWLKKQVIERKPPMSPNP